MQPRRRDAQRELYEKLEPDDLVFAQQDIMEAAFEKGERVFVFASTNAIESFRKRYLPANSYQVNPVDRWKDQPVPRDPDQRSLRRRGAGGPMGGGPRGGGPPPPAVSGEVDGPYTWWSMRGQAFDNETGWRIDYQLATPELAAAAVSARVDRAAAWGERWSDHAPLVIDYSI
jgi:hypothetical protein